MIKDNRYYCFSCGKGGNIINFVADHEGLSFYEAVEKLADSLNLNLHDARNYQQQKSLVQENERQVAFFKSKVSRCVDYLTKERHLVPEIIADYDLGYDEKSSNIVIPLKDKYGRIVAKAVRQFSRLPKYVNDKNNELYDKGSLLFNLDRARKKLRGAIYLVEGYFDAISGDQQGYATVAYCGSQITREQTKVLIDAVNNEDIAIVLCPDNDQPGQSKVVKMRKILATIAPNYAVYVLETPADCKDVNDCLVKGYDIGQLPVKHIDMFVLEQQLGSVGVKQHEYKIVQNYMKTVRNQMIRADIAKFLAQRWNQPVEETMAWLRASNKGDMDSILSAFKGPDVCAEEHRQMLLGGEITLGFPTIDASIGGGRRGDVCFFGGYSGVGKTFFAIDVALHNAIRCGHNVLFVSLEMSAGAVYERIIANILGMNTRVLSAKMRNGELIDVYDRVKEKLGKHLTIVDKSKLSVKDISNLITAANASVFDGKTDIVIIDYLQYMDGTHDFESLSQTARDLKPLAKDNHVFVLCLSQLSRSGSPWERPTMKELKGSGDIEATGDFILMGYRPAENPKMNIIEREEKKDIVNLTIEKSRRGHVVREIEVLFVSEETRMREVSTRVA